MPATAEATAVRIATLAAPNHTDNSASSLWDIANAKLNPKTRRILAAVNIGKGPVVDAVLEEAVTQQKALDEKRWKATIGGKEVILRDVIAKIVRWIDHFKAVGDIAVQFNSGAASLPWAAIRFLLQVSINDKQYLEATIEGIEIVTQAIATYAAVETLYMDSDFQLHTQIRSKVLGLYVHILSFLGESIQYFQQTMARRTAKGAFSTSQGERLQQIAKHDTEIRRLATMCDSHVQRLIRADVMRINENILTSLKAQAFSDFIAWLSLTPYREHHARHSKNRLRGTTQWLTNDSRYVDWKNRASSSLLWLHGIMGSGKTNMVSSVIDDSLKGTHSPVLYYYCGDMKGSGGSCDAKDVMRSLLRQLTVKNEETCEIVEQVHLEFKRREARGKVVIGNVDKLEPHECTHWIAELLQSDQATIIIDAIDEIDVAERYLLIKQLAAIRDDPARIMKILLSSRDDTNISQWLEGAMELRLQASFTQADMKYFIGHCVSSAVDNKYLLDGIVDSSFQSELEFYLLDRADGMFRWVELQLKHFCDLKSRYSIEQAMSDPAGASVRIVNDLYATIFDRMLTADPLSYDVALKMFQLMLCMHETMSPSALLAAASITRDGSRNTLTLSEILRTCSHLVVLDDELDTIRFAHVSVQEYLSHLPEFRLTNANSAAALSCLIRCIEIPLLDLTLGIQPSRDFDVYAAMYWPLHYNAASEHDRNGYLGNALREFMFSDEEFMSPFPAWIESVEEIAKRLSAPHTRLTDLTAIGSENATPLFTACIYGLEFAIEILSGAPSFDVNQKNSCGHTGLYLASAAGQISVVIHLLKIGADVEIEGGRHTTPLQAACANGHGDIAKLIIDFASQKSTAISVTSAIQVALRHGHEDIAVILLKKNALPMSQDTLDQILEVAAGMGFAELMDYVHLTSKSPSENKRLATRSAEKTFHDSKLLRFRNYFKNKALPNHALATAAFYGQNEIVKFCLDKGLDIEHEGPFGTPLRAASLMGHGPTVRLLLDKGAVINANSSFGDALQAAAMRGHLSITTILIQSGVALDNSGGYYGNALQAATYRGHIDVVKALLAAGASIGQAGLFGDALSAAVSAGNQSIADLLLQSGYQSPFLRDNREEIRTVLTQACMRNDRRDDLLSALDATNYSEHARRADVLSASDSTTHSKRNRQTDRARAIHEQDLSFEEAYKSIRDAIEVKSVTRLADPECPEQYRSHPLLIAIATGQEPVIRSMLDYRSNIGLSPRDIGTVLKEASATGQLGIVNDVLLLPELPREDIPPALERAAWYGHVAIIKRILKCEEVYGPPPRPDPYYAPFTPRGERSLLVRKSSQWLDLFYPSHQIVETNETIENGHVMRILLQGCRANAPATVELGLQLAAESGLQNLFAASLATVIKCNSEQALELFFRHYPAIGAVVLEKACAQAEEEGSLRVLYVLLQHDRDYGYQFQDYWTVFDKAAHTNHKELSCYLITQTLHWQADSVFARRFVEAAQRGHVSAMKAWERRLCQLADRKLSMAQALDQASANGHVVVVSYLIECGVDVNTIVDEPVQLSSYASYRFMSLHGEEVAKNDVWPRTALQACLEAIPQWDHSRRVCKNSFDAFKDEIQDFLSKQKAVIEVLLRENAKVNVVDSHGRSALHCAALYYPVETVRTILASGAAIEVHDKNDRTPLVYAAWRELDSLAVFQVLTKAEAQVTKTSAPRTPSALLLDAALSNFRECFIESESVHQVLTTGSGAVIRYILQSQIGLQATATGFTLLLQMASADGDFELLRLLIQRNIDFKAVAHYYGTALHAAARFGHLNCVKILVEAGAEIDLAAGDVGLTPLHAAVQGQHLAIVQYLFDCGVMQSYHYCANYIWMRPKKKCSTLVLACCGGNVDLVKLLLSHSKQSTLIPGETEIRRTQFADMSGALQSACKHGHATIAALLIEYGADLEEESDQFLTPLTAAAAAGNLEIMKLLLAAGATLYDAERSVNILRTIVERGQPRDAIDFVLARLLDTEDFIPACKEVPAFMSTWQEDVKFALYVATMQSSERLLGNLAALGAQRSIELLLERSIDIADVGLPVLQAAAYFQRYDVLFGLLPMVVIPRAPPLGYQSPVYAILEGLMPLKMQKGTSHECWSCKALNAGPFLYQQANRRHECDNARTTASEAIMKLAQIDENHICTSVGIIHLASYLGMLQVVQVCLKLGVETHQHHRTFGSALIAGVEGSSLEVVTLLLQHHIDVNTTFGDLGTPLHLACKTRPRKLQYVVDYATRSSGTALHRACQNGDREIAEVLLQHGAEVNGLCTGKGTPMHILCKTRNKELLQLLLRYGSDVDIISPDLGSALHVACRFDDADFIEILLQHGANVNVFYPDHGTPLHVACMGLGHDATIQLLLKYGADINSKGSKGETPLTLILSQRQVFLPSLLTNSLLKTEQRIIATENDWDQLLIKSTFSACDIQICKRVLSDNTHLQPTAKMIQLALANPECFGSDELCLLLARAPHFEITMEMVKAAKNFESFKFLTQHDSCVKITADMMESFLDPLRLDLVKYSVQSVPDIRPPPAVITAVRGILDQPEPKNIPSAHHNSQRTYTQHDESVQRQIANEIMEMIQVQHTDINTLP